MSRKTHAMTSRPPSASRSAPAKLRPSRSADAGDAAVREPAVGAGAGADGTVAVAAGVAVLPSAGEVMAGEIPAGSGAPGGAAIWVPAGAGTAEERGAGGMDGEACTPVALAVGTGVAVGFGRSGGVGQMSTGTIPPTGSQGAPVAGNARIRGADASINVAVTA